MLCNNAVKLITGEEPKMNTKTESVMSSSEELLFVLLFEPKQKESTKHGFLSTKYKK